MKLSNLQNKLIGKWIYQDGIIQKDIITQQIEWLINNNSKLRLTIPDIVSMRR